MFKSRPIPNQEIDLVLSELITDISSPNIKKFNISTEHSEVWMAQYTKLQEALGRNAVNPTKVRLEAESLDDIEG